MNYFSKIIRNFFDFIGFSNLFLAVGAFCSTLQGGIIFESSADACFLFAIINFTATFFLYNSQRIYQSFLPTTDPRLLWYRKNKKYIFLTALLLFFIFSGVVYNIFIQYKPSIIVYCISGILSIVYFLPPFELRKISFLKIFYISFAWILVCIFVPFMFGNNNNESSLDFEKDKWLYLLSQFCFIAAICIPFDIRDIEKDRAENVKSIPVLLGIKKSKIIGILLLSLYLIMAFFIEVKSLIFIRGIVFILSATIIWFSEPGRHRYYFIYLTDGLIIVQSVLLFIFL